MSSSDISPEVFHLGYIEHNPNHWASGVSFIKLCVRSLLKVHIKLIKH